MASPPQARKVMAFGTFDIIHKGHIFYLKEARKLGNTLVVVVARDANVQRIKGKKPMHNENARLEAIKKLDIADKACLGNDNSDLLKIIIEEQANVLALGYDQFIGKKQLSEKLAAKGFNVTIHIIPAYKPQLYKSSKLKASQKKQ